MMISFRAVRGIMRFIPAVILVFSTITIYAQSPEDESDANRYARLYPDNNVVCRSSHHLYTFGVGVNSLDEKVVVVEEDAELEFLATKRFASLTYAEFYNKFIELKTFKKSVKKGKKYVTADKKGIDEAVTDENIFFDDSRVRYFPIRFSGKADVARVTSTKKYTDGKYLARLFFQRSYPVLMQTFEFKVPEWLNISFKPMNFEGQRIERRQSTKGGYTTYVFVMRNLPAYKSEFRQLGRSYTEPHIVIQIKSFAHKNETYQGFDKTADVYRWNNMLYGMAGNDVEKIKPVLPTIINGANDDLSKIKAIYYYVQDKIRYIAFEDGYSGYIPASVQDVLANKYGDCKGMANLLTELLKLAGYDARFTWIGTRDLPYSQSLPALCVNNHAITTLYYNGKEYFLDPTEKYNPFGEDAYRIQGKEALISNGKKFEVKTVPLTTGSDHRIQTRASFTLKGDMLTGNVQVKLTGNERKDFHQVYQDLAISGREDFFNSFLEFGNSNVEASGIKTSNLDDREIPVEISGTIDLSNSVQSISGSQYMNIDFFPKTLESYIPDEKRINGYDFGYVHSYDDEFTLTIPGNPVFQDVPEKLEMDFEGYSFSGEYIVNGNTITLRKKLTLKASIVPKSDFENWKKFLTSIRDFSNFYFSVTTK